MHCAHPKTMGTRPLLLVDLEATLDRHWFGSEVVLQGAIPALEPPIARPDRGAIAKWRGPPGTREAPVLALHIAPARPPFPPAPSPPPVPHPPPPRLTPATLPLPPPR